MVALITASAPLNLAICEDIASDPVFVKAGITARGVAAKARSLGVEYNKVERVSKTGEAIATKEALVTAIETAVGVSDLASLVKAEKKALKALLAALTGSAAEAA
jgi:hypothetical protein